MYQDELLDYYERGVWAGRHPPAALQGQGGDGDEQLQPLHRLPLLLQVDFGTDKGCLSSRWFSNHKEL